jgi:hypothetical protein
MATMQRVPQYAPLIAQIIARGVLVKEWNDLGDEALKRRRGELFHPMAVIVPAFFRCQPGNVRMGHAREKEPQQRRESCLVCAVGPDDVQ